MIILKPEVEKDLHRLIIFLRFQVIIIMMIVLRILYQDDPVHNSIPLRIKNLRFPIIGIRAILIIICVYVYNYVCMIHYVCELISWD